MYDIRNLVEKTNPPPECKQVLIDSALGIYKIARAISKYSAADKVIASVYLAYERENLIPPRDLKPKFGALSNIRKAAGIPQLDAMDRIELICKKLQLESDSENISKGAKNILQDYMDKRYAEYANNSPSVAAAVAIYIASEKEGRHIKDSEFQHIGFARHLIPKKSKDLMEKLGYKCNPD